MTGGPLIRRASTVAAAAAALLVPLYAIELWLGITRPEANGVLPFTFSDAVWVVSFLAFGLVGMLLVLRRPRNPIGWLFLLVSMLGAVSRISYDYAARALVGGSTLPGGAVAAWLSIWTWAPPLAALVLSLLLFPNGRPPSPRWTWVGWLAVVPVAIVTGVSAISMWPLRGPLLLDAGAVTAAQGTGLAVTVVERVFPLFLLAAVLAMVSLIVRYRRAGGTERRQLKLLAVVAGVGAAALVAGELSPFPATAVVTDVVSVPGWFAIATGVAILRHGLFEIDRLMSRTVSYLVLTAGLVGVYAAGVVGLGALFRSLTGEGGSDLVVAASTLAVAAAFRPLRRRVQAFVDRRFNRSRYDAERTIGAFGARLRDEVDLEAIVVGLRDTVGDAFHPRHAGVVLVQTDGARR